MNTPFTPQDPAGGFGFGPQRGFSPGGPGDRLHERRRHGLTAGANVTPNSSSRSALSAAARSVPAAPAWPGLVPAGLRSRW